MKKRRDIDQALRDMPELDVSPSPIGTPWEVKPDLELLDHILVIDRDWHSFQFEFEFKVVDGVAHIERVALGVYLFGKPVYMRMRVPIEDVKRALHGLVEDLNDELVQNGVPR